MQPIIFTDYFFLDNHRSAATAVTHTRFRINYWLLIARSIISKPFFRVHYYFATK